MVGPGIVSDPMQEDHDEAGATAPGGNPGTGDADMVGGIEDFTLDDEEPTMVGHLDIDWDEGNFDLDEVKAGMCKEINTMIIMEVFEAISRDDVDPSWTWLSARWENQQREGSTGTAWALRGS